MGGHPPVAGHAAVNSLFMATIAVAVTALVVATIFNVLTLRQSAKNLRLAEISFERTQARYKLDQIQARNDRLRSAIVELSTVISGPWLNATFECQLAYQRHAENLLFVKNGNTSADTLIKSSKRINAALLEKLSPAEGDFMSALTKLLFLAAEIDELKSPLLMLADRFGRAARRPVLKMISSRKRI
jgi:hypothetical protein